MKKLAILFILFGFMAARASTTETRLGIVKKSNIDLSAGFIYENLGSQPFMLQAGGGYTINPQKRAGIRGLISPFKTSNEKTEHSLQIFYNVKNWDYNLAYNSITNTQFASLGMGYNLTLMQKKSFQLVTGIGADFLTTNIPSDLMFRLGLFSIAPKWGVNAVVDL